MNEVPLEDSPFSLRQGYYAAIDANIKDTNHKNEKFRVGVEPVDAVCQVAMHCMLPLLQLWVQLHLSGFTAACALLTHQNELILACITYCTGLAAVCMSHFQTSVGV